MCRLVSMYAHVVKLFAKIIVIKMIIIIINNDNNVDNCYKIYEATSTHARMNASTHERKRVRTYVCMYVCMYVSLMYVSRYVIKNINVIYKLLSYEVAPESATKPRIKNDNPLVG